MPKKFRFGVGLMSAKSRSAVQDVARRAEAFGYDVVHVPDHLGSLAPFPTLATAAAVTDTLRFGTYVLNAGFYKPALLARDVAAMRDMTDGRFELGLGAGYAREEFEAAELPFPTPGQRVDYLGHMTECLRRQVPDVPILIAGSGDRLLTIAARQAQIVGFTGGELPNGDDDPLATRVRFVRRAADERLDELEFNIAVTAVPTDNTGRPDLSLTRRFLPGLSDERLMQTPGVLSGTPADIADTLRSYRDIYGITYIIVQSPHAESFAKVIAELR